MRLLTKVPSSYDFIVGGSLNPSSLPLCLTFSDICIFNSVYDFHRGLTGDFYYRGLTSGFLLLRNFSVTIFVSPHVCFILV